MEEEHTRMNHRINSLEKSIAEISKLTLSVERLSVSVETMVKEQQKQGQRLEALESRDGEMWRKITSHVLTAIVGALVCFVMAKIGI